MNEIFKYVDRMSIAENTLGSIEKMFSLFCNQMCSAKNRRETFSAYKMAMENEFEHYNERIAEIEAKYKNKDEVKNERRYT